MKNLDQDNLLINEIEVFKPDVILSLGKKSNDKVVNLDIKVNHVNVLHPSGANNSAWKDKLDLKYNGESTSIDNQSKINYILNKIR